MHRLVLSGVAVHHKAYICAPCLRRLALTRQSHTSRTHSRSHTPLRSFTTSVYARDENSNKDDDKATAKAESARSEPERSEEKSDDDTITQEEHDAILETLREASGLDPAADAAAKESGEALSQSVFKKKRKRKASASTPPKESVKGERPEESRSAETVAATTATEPPLAAFKRLVTDHNAVKTQVNLLKKQVDAAKTPTKGLRRSRAKGRRTALLREQNALKERITRLEAAIGDALAFRYPEGTRHHAPLKSLTRSLEKMTRVLEKPLEIPVDEKKGTDAAAELKNKSELDAKGNEKKENEDKESRLPPIRRIPHGEAAKKSALMEALRKLKNAVRVRQERKKSEQEEPIVLDRVDKAAPDTIVSEKKPEAADLINGTIEAMVRKYESTDPGDKTARLEIFEELTNLLANSQEGKIKPILENFRAVVKRLKGVEGQHALQDVPGHQTLEKALKQATDMESYSLSEPVQRKRATQKLKSDVVKITSNESESQGRLQGGAIHMTPIEVEQEPVRNLSYGLDRILFNQGVYRLQDPRSKVYNFDPYLQKLLPVEEFNFDLLPGFITSSKDTTLLNIAKSHKMKYTGSSSSMTGILSQFHFLLSRFRKINLSMMSQAFRVSEHHYEHTNITKAPTAVFLRLKDGVYAIDSDKEHADTNVLSLLGQSLEKLLTKSKEDYELYRRGSTEVMPEEKRNAPETYHYTGLGDVLMRSQLDAHDPRLPGTGMFDLKTRAVLPIRMDAQGYQDMRDYEIKNQHGQFESFEREYIDMLRATMIKYMLQVRIGRMDGIFVAYHNTLRIFGFQYIPLDEIDLALHGQSDLSLGDQEFKLSVKLMNEVLNKATEKFPNTSLRLHFDVKPARGNTVMHIFAEPVTEEQAQAIQSKNDERMAQMTEEILKGQRPTYDQNGIRVFRKSDAATNVQDGKNKADTAAEDSEVNDQVPESAIQGEGGQAPLTDADAVRAALEKATGRRVPPMTVAKAAPEIEASQREPEAMIPDLAEAMVNPESEAAQREAQVASARLSSPGTETSAPAVPVMPDTGNIGFRSSTAQQAIVPNLVEHTYPESTQITQSQPNSEVVTVTETVSEDDLEDEIDKLLEGRSIKALDAEESAEDDKARDETSEEPEKSDADTEFLDSVDAEVASMIAQTKSPLLALTLTVENFKNGEPVNVVGFGPKDDPIERVQPESAAFSATRGDSWDVKYMMKEIRDPQKAWTLYLSTQQRRRMLLSPDRPVDNGLQYIRNTLKWWVKRGKKHRQRLDEEEAGVEKVVLGDERPVSGQVKDEFEMTKA